MSSSWLDILPASERQRIREKFKFSKEAYREMRLSVVGPEEMKRDAEYNTAVAELKFALETEPVVKEALKKQLESDLSEGVDSVCENATDEQKKALEQGNFDVTVEATDKKMSPDQLVIHPEGNVSEKIPIKANFSDKYITQFIAA